MPRIDIDLWASRVNDQFGIVGDLVGALQAAMAGKIGKSDGINVVTRFGAAPAAPAGQNGDAFGEALDDAQVLIVPLGSYTMPGEMAVKSETIVFFVPGAKLLMANGVNKRQNMITNISNTRSARTTLDKHIHIFNAWVDGNAMGANRDGSDAGFGAITTQSTSGCGIGLAGVEDFSLTDCRADNNWLHNIDVAASIYVPETAGNNLVLPDGMSRNGRLTRVKAGNVRVDDGVTLHGCDNVVVDASSAVCTLNPNSVLATQNGFEIDETCVDCDVTHSYSRGWIKGYQTKGHATTRAARGSIFDGCIAEGCNVSASLEYTLQSGISPLPAEWVAQDAKITNFRSIAPVSFALGSTTEFKGLNISGYSKVVAEDCVFEGGVHNNVTISNGAKHVYMIRPKIRGAFTAQPTGQTQKAWMQCSSDVLDVTLEDAVFETPISGPILNYFNPTGSVAVRGRIFAERNSASSAPAPWMIRVPPRDTCDIVIDAQLVNVGGYEDDKLIRVDTGYDPDTWAYASHNQGELPYRGQDLSWTAAVMDATNVASGAVVEFRKMRDGTAIVHGTFTTTATPSQGLPSTLLQLPTGRYVRSGIQIDGSAQSLTDPGKVMTSVAIWINDSAQLRGYVAPSTTYSFTIRYLTAN